MRLLILAACTLACGGCSARDRSARHAGAPSTREYPAHWWTPVPPAQAASWEILPQAAGPGEVIVSKRNELGLLSNFAAAPFTFQGHSYASLEGFWQMMKFPEGPNDPRATFPGLTWPFTREQVARMTGFDAKRAGDAASANMKLMNINWVTFEGERFTYHTPGRSCHYDLIVAATWAKVRQNPRVRALLLATGDLVLRPDHHQATDAPPAWRYCEILMDIRSALQRETD